MCALWFWLLIIVIGDLFRRHDISGWVKAIWVIALIVFPYLALFAYIITQSRGMTERNSQQAQQTREELRRVVGFSVADEIEELDGLKNRGRSPIRSSLDCAPSWFHNQSGDGHWPHCALSQKKRTMNARELAHPAPTTAFLRSSDSNSSFQGRAPVKRRVLALTPQRLARSPQCRGALASVR
jgi:hypothetical protein